MPRNPYSKRADGRYYKHIIVGVDENGKRKVKTLYDRDWRALDKKVREFEIQLANGKYINDNITFGECAKMWWNTLVNILPSTQILYKSALHHLECLANMKLSEIKPMHLQKLYSDLYKHSPRGTLLPKVVGIVKRILDFAVLNDFVSENVANKVKPPKTERGKRRALTNEEKAAVQQAFTVFTPFQKTLVAILLYTGMRRGEVLALKITDIHFDEHYISVERSTSVDLKRHPYEKQGTKTKAGVRKIPLLHELEDILHEYIDGGYCYKDGHLFMTRNGTLVSGGDFAFYWRKILAVINSFMPADNPTSITPHYFRHNFATEMVYAKLPLKTIQYIMGHENIQITMDIYADTRIDIQDSIDTLETYWKDTNG